MTGAGTGAGAGVVVGAAAGESCEPGVCGESVLPYMSSTAIAGVLRLLFRWIQKTIPKTAASKRMTKARVIPMMPPVLSEPLPLVLEEDVGELPDRVDEVLVPVRVPTIEPGGGGGGKVTTSKRLIMIGSLSVFQVRLCLPLSSQSSH